MVTFTCHPIKTMEFAGFRFEKSTLQVAEADAYKLRDALARGGPRIRGRIRELSAEAAEAVVERVLGAHRGPVTSDSMRAAEAIAAEHDRQLKADAEAKAKADAALATGLGNPQNAPGVVQPDVPTSLVQTNPGPSTNPVAPEKSQGLNLGLKLGGNS